ncbi:UV excision repair protein rhp23 [Cytospora mali]|uniref:UV excision repair protein rhp23 n=1 Tax=Cytospora mali TaxID=578113 RepID=A0A194VPM6_CYTMA|nr:UV excision repair protein rhp23 [Valsa mali]
MLSGIFMPGTAQQEAIEEARRQNKELYSTTPRGHPIRLNPAAPAFYPRSHCVKPALNDDNNKAIETNNSPQSLNTSPHTGSIANSIPSTVNHVTRDEMMELIEQVTQGYPHQNLICKLLQTLPMPVQSAPGQTSSAIAHHQDASSGDISVVRPIPAVMCHTAEPPRDGQTASVQPTSKTVNFGGVTRVQPGVITAHPVEPDASDFGYHFALMFIKMREMGFENSQINAAMRAADNNIDRAVEYLVGGIQPNNEHASNDVAAKHAGLAQGTPIQAVTTAIAPKDTLKDHTTTIQSPSIPTCSGIHKAAPIIERSNRPRGNTNDFQCVSRSFKRAMHQANADAARPRRVPFDPFKYSKGSGVKT